MKTTAGATSKGDFIELNGHIFQIQNIEHNFRGRGSANLRLKLKNLSTGNTVEETFKPDNTLESVSVDAVEVHFLFKDNLNLTFMNPRTYEQFELNAQAVGNFINYLKEGQSIYAFMNNGTCLAIRPPNSVVLKVTEAEDAVKGNTASGARKIVTLETGAKVNVPLFIKKGESIVINPETGEYIERG